jgi:lysophospholipid acyltransferase (LPLAT)-like uncharacterized protein
VKLLAALCGIIVPLVLRALMATCRVRYVRREIDETLRRGGAPALGVFWHAQFIPFLHFYRHRGVVTMVSRSRDGELVTAVLRRIGLGVVRGSSSRGGGPALLGIIDAVRRGRCAATPVDGPRGPARIAKPGLVLASRATGAPLIPLAWAADRWIAFRSWDRTRLPLPGARIVIGWGTPLPPPADDTPATLERTRCKIEESLETLEAEVRHEVDTWRRAVKSQLPNPKSQHKSQP